MEWRDFGNITSLITVDFIKSLPFEQFWRLKGGGDLERLFEFQLARFFFVSFNKGGSERAILTVSRFRLKKGGSYHDINGIELPWISF